ncbi:putative Zn peptidase [Halobacteroides halobius DSM 5150]|uniref:Putative Zn peptidase n=1 Tax=Halobacteroides halobius (strain ATCC 35273 / DSM 5150 / MD-1) TaxID=748449 RepID=L0KAB3_HALHC|nr:ImmA/IrrE family metallo-endopeptidase [Halobacteroides halobius]AGB42247.1 putative Zn peptidase [Halobacteroides halobius DSM 5150]
MDLLKQTIKNINPDLYEEIAKEATYVLKKFGGAHGQALQDDIFRIIPDQVDLLRFPVEDDDFCGFICNHQGETFIYINTYLSYEKQIFATAHELYHFRNNRNGEQEVLHQQVVNQENNIDLEESKANLFAALLLVPEESLKEELDLLQVNQAADLDLLKLIKLMDTFAVPYKTIILRLYEIELLTTKEAQSWLDIPDRDPKQGVLYHINKHQIGQRWQKRTKEVKYSNLKPLILDNDAAEILPKTRIEQDLELIGANDEQYFRK